MTHVAVLIPCYNEEQTVGKVIDDWKKALPEATVYVYDNNSTDKTSSIAIAHGAIVRKETHQGKGNVIRRMFREIDAECYVLVDGDDTYPAEIAQELVSPVLYDGVDMVIGDRLSSTYASENKRPFHNFGNTLVRKLINSLLHADIKDVMTGLRALSYRFVKTYAVLSSGFELETEMTIHAIDKRLYVQNIPIPYRDRPDGSESKLNTYSDGAKVLWTILRLYRNLHPFAFFGWISVALSLLAVAFFIPVLADYLHTGLVLRFPTLIVCGFTAIAAIQSFFSGLVLETLEHRHKEEFEKELIMLEHNLKTL